MKKVEYVYIFLGVLIVAGINFYSVFIIEAMPFLPEWIIWVLTLIGAGLITWRVGRIEYGLAEREYEFINVVTHTFRTPTTVVKWSIDGLHKSEHFPDIQDDVNQIESANERIIALLDTLIGFSSLVSEEHYTFAATSFREMVEQSLTKYGPKMKEKELVLTVDIPVNIPLITADQKRLQFVVEVLVQNAIMYTPAKGQIYVGLYQDKDAIVMTVKDSGMGITRKDKKHLFVKFFRSHEATVADVQGVGLGLFVAKKIVDRHHGKIWAESEGQGKGATFYVKINLR